MAPYQEVAQNFFIIYYFYFFGKLRITVRIICFLEIIMFKGEVVYFVWFCLIAVLPTLRKLKALDISGNEFSASMGLQGKSKRILSYCIKTGGEIMLTHV